MSTVNIGMVWVNTIAPQHERFGATNGECRGIIASLNPSSLKFAQTEQKAPALEFSEDLQTCGIMWLCLTFKRETVFWTGEKNKLKLNLFHSLKTLVSLYHSLRIKKRRVQAWRSDNDLAWYRKLSAGNDNQDSRRSTVFWCGFEFWSCSFSGQRKIEFASLGSPVQKLVPSRM